MDRITDLNCVNFLNDKDNSFTVEDNGIVPPGFDKISATRGENNKINIRFIWTRDKPEFEREETAGKISEINNETILHFRFGEICKLKNLSSGQYGSYANHEGFEVYFEFFGACVEICYPNVEEEKWDIINIGNVANLGFVYDKSSKEIDRELCILNLDDGVKIINRKSHSRSHGSYASIILDEKKYYLYMRDESAFILTEYNSERNRSDWQKILNCISFAFGRYFTLLGRSIFNENWQRNISQEFSAYTEKGALCHDISSQPSPLGRLNDNGTISLNLIDSDRLSRFISNMLRLYDEYNFDYLTFVYFYGYHMPVHLSPVIYAAAVEALMGRIGAKISSNVIDDKPKVRLIRKNFKQLIDYCELSDNQKSDLKGNIDRINFRPIKEQIRIFCEREGLVFSDIEKTAWNRRNSIAHGRFEDQRDIQSTIKDVRILRILMVRVMLSLFDDDWCYFDYSSLNFPIRIIKDPPLQEGV